MILEIWHEIGHKMFLLVGRISAITKIIDEQHASSVVIL